MKKLSVIASLTPPMADHVAAACLPPSGQGWVRVRVSLTLTLNLNLTLTCGTGRPAVRFVRPRAALCGAARAGGGIAPA